MELGELQEALRYIESDVKKIVEAQRTLANIKRELDTRERVPFEEDLIDIEAFGDQAFDGRVFEVDGVPIIVRKMHRRGAKASDIKGADLLYEIENEKFVLVQYKRPNDRGGVAYDEEQIESLMISCPRPCATRPDMMSGCGAWHAVAVGEGRYHPACAAEFIFDDHPARNVSSFADGLTKDEFTSLFAKCWVGSRIAPVHIAGLVHDAFNDDHLLVAVLQRGRFDAAPVQHDQ